MMRLVAVIAVWLVVICESSGALAHASLVGAEPRDGSTVAQAPGAVRLRFNEPVTPAVIGVIDAQGRSRADVAVYATGETIEIMLPAGLPAGTQVISYRVISADGHPVAGSMMFSVGMGRPVTLPTGSSSTLGVLIWLSRVGLYLGLFVGVGGVFFNAWTADVRTRSKPVVAALALGSGSAAVSLGCQGLDLLGLPVSDVLTAAPWQAAIKTTLGPSLVLASAAMGLSYLGLRFRSARAARTLSAVALAGVGLSLAASGHAGTAPPQWLTRPVIFLHGAGLAWWVGALLPLMAQARGPAPSLLPPLHRFSKGAVPVVGMVALTGGVLAVIQLESVQALVGTNYGRILCIKLALVVVLLGLAALNRFRLTPALRSPLQDGRALVRSIGFECAVAVGILALAAGWRFTPPPRSLMAAIPPLALHIHSDRAMFQVLISPGRAGTDDFELQIMAADASPLQAKEVSLFLSLPEKAIEPMERRAMQGADSTWTVRDVPIPFAGRWRVRIEALVTDFEKVTLEDEADLPAP
ncbi:copper resistance CopC/CopD family protein [uncultured Bradyrhizobium sp.]|uniref:copper resistance CopC/CopD family protein n=1 Tax=uncultured Bradyrhizobium sp. TaxID=199684 RepID=UPI0035C99F72